MAEDKKIVEHLREKGSHRRLDRSWSKVARWYICIPKISIWVYFGVPWNGKCCFIL
jgi:hypothetical protein